MNFPAALMRCVWKSASDSAVNPPACRPLRGWGKGALSWKEAALQVPRRAAPKGGPVLPVGQAPPPPRPPGPGPGKRNVIWVLPPLFLTAGHLCGMCEVCHRQSSRGEHRQPTSTHRQTGVQQLVRLKATAAPLKVCTETHVFRFQTLHCFFIFLTCFLKRRKPDLDVQ